MYLCKICRTTKNIRQIKQNSWRLGSCMKSDNKGVEVDKPACSSFYDARKYSHNLPGNDVDPWFPTLKDFPSGIFRRIDCEILGPGADNKNYFSPEYFAWHHMSYYDLHSGLQKYRNEVPKTGRKA